jgi:hypothetical protein
MQRLVLLFVILSLALMLYAQSESCLSLGGNTTNQYVNIPGSSNLDTGNTYTLEAWVKPAGFAAFGGIISQYTNGPGFVLRLIEGGDHRGINFDEMVTADDILTAGTWYHIAAVNSNGARTLYLNGVAQTLTGAAFTPSNSQRPITIGRDWSVDNTRCFNGLIDEVRIWRTARTQAQVIANMDNEMGGSESGLVASFSMNEGSGATITAGSPYTVVGALRNSPTWFVPGYATVGGAGVSANPYLITNKYELNTIVNNTGFWSKHFSQTHNIIFTINDFATTGLFYHNGAYWTPIGNATTAFTGSYDGNGHTIDGIHIASTTSTGYLGFFGCLSGATIANLNFTTMNINGYDYVGGLAGSATGANTITNISVSGVVRGYATGLQNDMGVGGIIGILNGSGSVLSGLHFSGSVYGNARIGGLIGWTKEGITLTDSYSEGVLSLSPTDGARFIGGITSVVESSTGATMTIPTVFDRVYSTCIINGNVSSGNTGDVGGLVGIMNHGAILRNCYATGAVHGPTSGAATTRGAGGLVGRVASSACQIVNCYSTGSVSGSTSAGYVGGLIGASAATATGCFWNTATSGQATSAGGATGLTTDQMKQLADYYDAGWDFVLDTLNGAEDAWNMDGVNASGYPFLSWQAPSVAASINCQPSQLYLEMDAQSTASSQLNITKNGDVGAIFSVAQEPRNPDNITYHYQNFNSGIPGSWTVVNGLGSHTWEPGQYYSGMWIDGSLFAMVHGYTIDEDMDESLISPAVNLVGCQSARLEFDQIVYQVMSTVNADVDVWNGSEWVSLLSQTADLGSAGNPAHTTLDISEYINSAFKVRFHFTTLSYNAWLVDNVRISGQYPPPLSFDGSYEYTGYLSPTESECVVPVQVDSHFLSEGLTQLNLDRHRQRLPGNLLHHSRDHLHLLGLRHRAQS